MIEKNKGYIVNSVEANSIAEQIGIEKGARVIGFNREPFIDIIDYVFFSSKEKFTLSYIDLDGDVNRVKIKKFEDEPLGIDFEDDLLGDCRSCKNKCIFCFVDQLPKGLRKSLYHKDEDWRYSFIYGNYVTLANISDEDVKRIVKRKISNLFISVHAIDHDVRSLLLGNKKAKNIKKILRTFAKSGVKMQTQIVLCKGINDGLQLKKTFDFLYKLYPYVESISVIPAGLTECRNRLYKIEDFSAKEASIIIDDVESWQKQCKLKVGSGVIYASDEMYIKAKRQIPDYESYDGFPQIENGVGMVRKFERELLDSIDEFNSKRLKYKRVSIVTGYAFYKYLNEYCKMICEKYDVDIKCYQSENEFFGGKIDITGLLTSTEIIKTLSSKDIGDVIFLSSTMIKENKDVFLDNISIEKVEENLGCDIVIVPNNGYDFIKSFFVNDEE